MQVQWGYMCMGLKDRRYITKQQTLQYINKQRQSLLLKHTFHFLVALVESDCSCKVNSREEDGSYSCGQLVEYPDKIFQVVLSLQT